MKPDRNNARQLCPRSLGREVLLRSRAADEGGFPWAQRDAVGVTAAPGAGAKARPGSQNS